MRRSVDGRKEVVLNRTINDDWTAVDGRANCSEEYERLVGVVEDIICGSSHQLINGSPRQVARLIVSWLAHKEGIRPKEDNAGGY